MAISTTREELTDEKEVTIFDHLEERRGRLLIAVAEASCSWSSFSCSCSVWIILPGSNEVGSGDQMLLVWRYIVVGAVIAAAIVTHSTDTLTQCLVAGLLTGLYTGGASCSFS
ncbi:unnamed protein product [Sphagnum troendelagicum]|uniref:Uncharacterized protein n=1 Tax=Sphagnum troendelagicum TaxID=128251 RepID=A0ABP0U095_9BRYO